MKLTTFIIVILIIGFAFISCEGPKYFSVTVVDKLTRKPLDSVFVSVKVMDDDVERTAYDLQGYTDSTGKFVKEEMIGYGLSIRRWDFFMEYDKQGYLHKTEVNHTEGVVELKH